MTLPAPTGGEAHPWKPILKVLGVLAGYSAALLAACVAVYIRQLNTQGPDAQASAGMYAFGDGMLFIEVFGGLALLPTGLGLYYLRPLRIFWTLLAIAAMPLAATGPVSVVLVALSSKVPNLPSFWQMGAAFGVLRMLGSPLLAASFLLGGCLAPTRFPRWTLMGATVIEGAVAAYAAFHWFIAPRLL